VSIPGGTRPIVNTHELYQSGDLQGAIRSSLEEVRLHPTDTARRLLLCELLCFAGDLERADRQLEMVARQDPESVPGIHAFQQLIRAEEARQQFFTAGRLPEFLGPPNDSVRLLLEASIRVREGAFAEAAEMLARAEEGRPRVSGTCNGQPFQDLRDLDDQTSCVLEVLAGNGRYYWAPIGQVQAVEFQKPTRPRDLLWRPARLVVGDVMDGEVFLPALYAGSHAEQDDRARLGRETDWRGGERAPTRGVGQRMFLVGDEARTILEIASLRIAAPAPG